MTTSVLTPSLQLLYSSSTFRITVPTVLTLLTLLTLPTPRTTPAARGDRTALATGYTCSAYYVKVGAHDQLRVVLSANTLLVHVRNDSELSRGRAHPVLLQLLKLLCCSPGGLPDSDLVLNAGDYGLVDRSKYGPRAKAADSPPPVWSFAKHPAHHLDLFYPYWLAQWLEEARRSSAATAVTPWEQKAPRLVWRGSQTGNPPTGGAREHRNTWQSDQWRFTPRGQLVRRCANLSALICDAGFHRFAPRVSEPVRHAIEAEGGGLRPRLEWAEMQRSRFVGLIDGEGGTAASRSLREFGEGGTASFKTESPDSAAEFWYALLRPYVHYVPLSPSLEDLEGRLAWARAHDGEMRRIAEAAARLKRSLLTDARILCYMRARWRRYAALLRFNPDLTRILTLTLTRYAALLRFKPSAPRASKACGVRFRRLKVLPSTAQYLLAYVERHNLTASLGWCAAVLHNHSRHPEQKGTT